MDMVSKRELRKQMQTVAGDPAMEDDATLRALLFSPLLVFADRVFAFVPLPTEPDISPLLSDLSIALPLCHPDGTMEFHAVPNDWRAHIRYGSSVWGSQLMGKEPNRQTTPSSSFPAWRSPQKEPGWATAKATTTAIWHPTPG
jgi:5-formyltetrahydrofolate cyclo-ligase